jgi:hypothetical protein
MSSPQTPVVVACADCAKRDEVLDNIIYDLMNLQQMLINNDDDPLELIADLISYVNSSN